MKKELLEIIHEAPTFLSASMEKHQWAEGRRRQVLFYSGAKVERYDWYTDESYDLSFAMDGADLSRLMAGAPVLDGHSQFSAADVIGKVEGARKTDKGYAADLLFSESESVFDTWTKIEEGILNAVSMGVKVLKVTLKDDDKKNKRKHYMATEWQPFELSVVPIGADPGARFLSMDPRLERVRAIDLSVDPGAASKADDSAARARYLLAIKASRYRVLGAR